MIFLWFSFSTPYVYYLCEYVIVVFFFFFFAVDGYELNICIIDLWVYNCEFVTVFVSLY